MVCLSDAQLEMVMTALRPLRGEKERAEFLKVLDDQLKIRDVDVISACERASRAVGDG
jgi:hypothetical protein